MRPASMKLPPFASFAAWRSIFPVWYLSPSILVASPSTLRSGTLTLSRWPYFVQPKYATASTIAIGARPEMESIDAARKSLRSSFGRRIILPRGRRSGPQSLMNQGPDGDPPYTSEDLFGELVDKKAEPGK